MSDGTQDYKTLRVPEGAWADAKEQKEAAGRTWGEQIVRPEGDGPNGTTPILDYEPENMAEFERIFDRLNELERHIPERTADELEGRFR